MSQTAAIVSPNSLDTAMLCADVASSLDLACVEYSSGGWVLSRQHNFLPNGQWVFCKQTDYIIVGEPEPGFESDEWVKHGDLDEETAIELRGAFMVFLQWNEVKLFLKMLALICERRSDIWFDGGYGRLYRDEELKRLIGDQKWDWRR